MKSLWVNSTFLKIFSVVLAIAAWFYIMIVQDPVIDQNFKNIAVTPGGNDVLLARGLVVVDQHKMRVSLKARSNRRAISLLDDDSFSATVDVSGITQTGTYTLPVNITVNDNTVSITDKKPYYLDVLVDHYAEVYKDVEIVTTGELKQGYTMRQITLSPTRVLLKGPQSVVDDISRVVLPVSLDNLSSVKSEDVKFRLLDDKGNELTDPNIVKVVDAVNVNLDIVPYQSVPFSVDLTSPEGLLYHIDNVSIQPESIRLMMPTSSTDVPDNIYLGSFDVNPNATSITVPVNLPEDVEAVDQFTTVTIEYTLQEMELPTGEE